MRASLYCTATAAFGLAQAIRDEDWARVSQRVLLDHEEGGQEVTESSILALAEQFMQQDSAILSASTNDFKPIGAAKSVEASNVTDALIVGGSNLPDSLQGIFWLTNQKSSSAAMSFGGPSKDGGGSSTGRLSDDGRYDIRVPGDRVWSFATDGPTSLYERAAQFDLVYSFDFDNHEDPHQASIVPSFQVRNRRVSVPTWLMDFQMTLADPGEFDETYPGSTVWKRNSFILGREMEDAYYDLVQVVDGNGHQVEPAWSLFVLEQTESPGWDNSSPGTIFYREIE